MENYIERLTQLQNEVGYTKGKINNVALFGLFGEAGEVLNECKHKSLMSNDLLEVCPDAVAKAIEVDNLKKKIRDRYTPPLDIVIENEEAFDMEMADVLYYLNALSINRGKTLNDYAKISYDKVMHYKQQKDIKHANVSHGTTSE